MWHLWLKSDNKWIESTKGFVEEMDARKEGKRLLSLFSLDQVFIQFDFDECIEITNQEA